MTGFDTARGRVWAVLLGLMGGMIIGLPFRPGLTSFGQGCHAHCGARFDGTAGAEGTGCPWLRRHPGYVPGATGETPPCEQAETGRTSQTVTLPPSHEVREIRVAPGVGVRLDVGAAGTGAVPVDRFYHLHRDPFIRPVPR